MKKNGGGKFNIWLVLLIVFIVGIFALFAAALITQYAVYGGKFPSVGAEIKYVFIAFIIALPLLLVFLIVSAFSKKNDCSLVTPQYFGVDFEKEVQNKPKLKDMGGSIPVATTTSAPIITSALNKNKEEKEEGSGSRFYMLTEIDKEYESYKRPEYDEEITLKELCEEFRNYSAGELKLYYDIEDIRRFIGALAVTKLIILQGMSGTGKTSLAYAFGEFLDNKTVVVPIQPMWKERTDLVGYYNEFTKKFNETTLLYKMYEANNNEEIYITVLDEMNIARVEYYFAEFLSLLEIPNPDGRNLDVVADKREDDPKLLQNNGKLRLPTNMWFVGTANNDDSTFSISDKVYDRAMVLNLDKKAVPFEAKGNNKKISATRLEELMQKAQREYDITDRNLRRIKKLDEYMIKTFHITFGNRIMKQIKTYVPVLVACGGTELEAIDDILARKVFRKLESKNPVYVKQMADGACGYLDELFGENKLPLCKETIRLIEQNV